MSKPTKVLVITAGDDLEIFTQRMLKEMGVSEEDIPIMFSSGYWIEFVLKPAKFGDQQAVIRECIAKDGTTDESLEPQKRFVKAIEAGTLTKQYLGKPEKEIWPVAEGTLLDMDPPGLGNTINGEILRYWYPGATTKTRDFMQAWLDKQTRLEAEKKSMSTPSTPES